MKIIFYVFFLSSLMLMANERPNLIIINIDNHDKGSLGYFGNEFIETPHIDKLFEQGIRLQNYHTAGRCTSSRSALITGRYHARNGALGTGGAWGQSINDGIKTIANVFQDAGYQTAMFGKWHLGDSHGLRPEDRGFEEVCAFENGAYLPGVVVKEGYNGTSRTAEAHRFNHNGEYELYEGFRTDVWFRECGKYLEEKRDKTKPFFIYLATITAHGPHYGPEDLQTYYKKKYETDEFKFLRDKFENNGKNKKGHNGLISYPYDQAADVASVDRNVGRLMAKLKDLSLDQNTIVVYMSDGSGTGPASLTGKELKKAELSNNPTAIYWPGKKAVDVAGPLVANIDILPSFAEICGIQLSEEFQESIDGQSFAASLEFEGASEWKERSYISDHQSTGSRQGFNYEMVLKPLNVTTVVLPSGQSITWRNGEVLAKGMGPETIDRAKQAYDKWLKRVLLSFPVGAYVQTQESTKPVFLRSYPIKDGPAGEGIKTYFLLKVLKEGVYTLDSNVSDYFGANYKDQDKSMKVNFSAFKKIKASHLPLTYSSQEGLYRVSSRTFSDYFKESSSAENDGRVDLSLSPGKYLINMESSKILKMLSINKVPKLKLRVSRKI